MTRPSSTDQSIDTTLKPENLIPLLLERFEGLHPVETWGETALFYNPHNLLKRGVYFATLKEKDGDNDSASRLNRDGVFRFNLGTTKPMFQDLFGAPPTRPAKGETIDGPWDFSALDRVMPHPVYGWMSWICVLCPSTRTIQAIDPMIEAAYAKACSNFSKRRVDVTRVS